MRLAYLCLDEGIPFGSNKGSAIHVLEFTRTLIELGHDVIIIPSKSIVSNVHDKVIEKIVTIHEIGHISMVADEIEQLMGDKNLGDEIYQFINQFAKQERLTKILSDFQPEAIYERYSLFGFLGCSIAERLSIPFVLEVNAPISLETQNWRNLRLVHAANIIEKEIFQKADIIITVSEELKKYVSKMVSNPDKVKTLPNGVNVKRFHPDLKYKVKRTSDRPIIGYVGGFKKWHDLETLLRAFAKLEKKDINHPLLLLIGDGPARAPIISLAHELGIYDDVSFVGLVPYDDVPEYLARIDIAVVPFKRTENFYYSPLKLFEYMAMGLCIVAPKLGQLEEIIGLNNLGFLYNPEDPDDLVTVLSKVLINKNYQKSMGRRARAWVEKNSNWEFRVEQALSWIEEYLANKGE